MKFKNLLLAASAALPMLIGCGGESSERGAAGAKTSDGLDRVSIILNWFPEMEHGGFYAAAVEGIYEREGLDVTIAPGGVDIPVIALVATGRHTFGVANADDVIMGQAEGADLVALFAPLQNSPRIIMVHQDSGIRSLADLRNMTLAMGIGAGFSEFVRRKFPLENVTIVPYPGSISVFLGNKNFAQQAYNISEPFLALENGGEPHNIFVSEYGYNPYTSVLLVSRSYLEANRDVVRRVVRASLEGWELYMKEPIKTNAHITSLNPQMGPDILAFGVAEMQDLVFTPESKENGLGTMNSQRWEEMVRVMEEVELIRPGAVRPSSCFTLEFIR